MRKFPLLLMLLFLTTGVMAQKTPQPGALPSVTVANLPTAHDPNQQYRVSDGASATDCTAGGGSSLVTCTWNGSVYIAVLTGTSAPGGGSVLTIGCTTAAGVSCTSDGSASAPRLTFALGAITPSSVVSSGNIVGANVALGFATTATAAGTTTLTVSSKGVQAFTGVTTQTVVLPVVSTLPQTGFGFVIQNDSSDVLTVNSSGGNLVQTMAAGTRATFTCKLLTGTTAASWNVAYLPVTFGISNSAGANVVPKSNGTNLVASRITDDGTAFVFTGAGLGTFKVEPGTGDGLQLFNGDDGNLIFIVNADDGGIATGGIAAEGFLRIKTPNGSGDIRASDLTTAKGFQLPDVSGTLISGTQSAADLVLTATASQSFVTPNIKVAITSDLTATPTVNTPGGIVRIAAAASTVTVTCANCATTSLVFAQIQSVDTTLKSVVVTKGSGSFVLIGNAVATANTDIQLWIVNPN